MKLLYAFFWVIPRRLKFICRRFGTFCLFHLHRQVRVRRMNWVSEILGYHKGKGLAVFSSERLADTCWNVCRIDTETSNIPKVFEFSIFSSCGTVVGYLSHVCWYAISAISFQKLSWYLTTYSLPS
jgi:hypothetical protein